MICFLLVILGISSRVLPHPANFTAVGAVALYSGYYIKNKKLAVGLPIILMLLSDWKLGFYQWQMMASVYVSFVLILLLGTAIGKKKWYLAVPVSVVGTVIFFLITNWAVWQFSNWYPHTMSGLLTCYVSGLPFVKNTFIGDLFYTVSFFSITEAAMMLASKQSGYRKKMLFLE